MKIWFLGKVLFIIQAFQFRSAMSYSTKRRGLDPQSPNTFFNFLHFSRFLFVWFLCMLLFSCRKDKPEDNPQPSISINENGVYITNEGNFQFGNAKVSYYDPAQKTVKEDLFQPANNRPLGDVCQSMYLFNGKAYLILNNSGKIEVVNPGSFVSTAIITGLTSPRYFLPVSNNKAYVTDFASNNIAIVDLSKNTITGKISCIGWAEELALAYGKAFVTNQKRDRVYVINTTTDLLADSITVGYGSNSIVEDKNGKLWVLCGGSQIDGIKASLHCIDPISNTVEQAFQFPGTSDAPWRLDINGSNDTLYFLNKGVFRMAVNSTGLPADAFILEGNNNFYGLGIDPVTNIIYVSDAVDYVQTGVIYRYTSQGILLNTFRAGIIPGDFYFKS